MTTLIHFMSSSTDTHHKNWLVDTLFQGVSSKKSTDTHGKNWLVDTLFQGVSSKKKYRHTWQELVA
jgi:ATP-dependent helicase/DNAse subunit B